MEEEKDNVLYCDLKKEAIRLLESNELPKSLVFCGKSAYCRNVPNTIIDGYVVMIDKLLNKKDKTGYDKQEMIRMKDRMHQMIEAMKDPLNVNITEEDWFKMQRFEKSNKQINNK